MSRPSIQNLLYQADPEKLFGCPSGSTLEEQLQNLENRYRGFALVLPVDAPGVSERLAELYTLAKKNLQLAAVTNLPHIEETHTAVKIITTSKGEIKLGRLLWQDTVCDLLACDCQLNNELLPCTARLSGDPESNELIQHEATILTKLGADSPTNDAFHAHFRRYLPTMLGIFTAEDLDQVNRLDGILFQGLEDFRTLTEVHEAFPDGVEFQTAVWMFNRLLEGLGYVHQHKVIHGGLIPHHILIQPTDHAAKIMGWNAAVSDPSQNYDHVRLLHDGFHEFYPPEILEKEIPSPATDIFMAAKCIVYVLNGNMRSNRMPQEVPAYLQDFLRSCLIMNPYQRPHDAWEVRDRFNEFMQDHYGPRHYHLFRMPERYNRTNDRTKD